MLLIVYDWSLYSTNYKYKCTYEICNPRFCDKFCSYPIYEKKKFFFDAKVQKTKVEPFTKKLNLKLNDSFYETKLNPVYVGRAYTEEELKYAVDNGFRQQLSSNLYLWWIHT